MLNEIYKGKELNHVNGKRKGGLKVHMAVQAKHDVPCLVRITSAATNDNVFTNGMRLAKGSYVVFDKGYHSHKQYNEFDANGVSWVSRIRNNSIVKIIKESAVDEKENQLGVRKDEQIIMGHSSNSIIKVKCRRITFFDSVNRR